MRIEIQVLKNKVFKTHGQKMYLTFFFFFSYNRISNYTITIHDII
jgi:hypothetical protein